MEQIETDARLEWSANSSMSFGPFDVAVAVAAVNDGWDVRARLKRSGADNQADAFKFLCDLDPVFLLTFADGTSFPVSVAGIEHGSTLLLREIVTPATSPTQG